MPVKMYDVTARVFAAMQNLDITSLASYPENEIRPVLPSLVRMSLLSPLDNTESSMESRKQILAVLIGIEVVNSIVSYLQVNYHELENDLKKELQTRQKNSAAASSSFPFDSPSQQPPQPEYGLQSGIALGFERADVARKVRVVLSEIFNLQQQVSGSGSTGSTGTTTGSTCGGSTGGGSSSSGGGGGGSGSDGQKPVQAQHSEILDDGIYLEEVVDILCIALAELPSLLNILELTDALLQVPNGHRIICALVANFPDCYRDVVTHVIANCDEEATDGKQRQLLLIALSEMNPSQALANRSMCVELMKVPSFMLKLALKHPDDLVSLCLELLQLCSLLIQMHILPSDCLPDWPAAGQRSKSALLVCRIHSHQPEAQGRCTKSGSRRATAEDCADNKQCVRTEGFQSTRCGAVASLLRPTRHWRTQVQ